eukprot:12032765-Ditylum_brightwellii.AAC.1
MATMGMDKSKAMGVKVAHTIMGYMNKIASWKAVKHLGFDITRGTMMPRGACAEAKAKRTSLSTQVQTTTIVMRYKEKVKAVN